VRVGQAVKRYSGKAVGTLVAALFLTALPLYRSTAQSVPDSVTRALAVAADSAAPLEARVAALRALRGSCAPGALPTLTALAEPYRRPWVIWHGAMTVLSDCALAELAPYWRDMITFPRRPVRELAIVGLARTGLAGDRELLGEVMHREDDAHLRRLGAWADSLLGRPLAARAGVAPPRF
jgi:hypothetical protein